jgi:hypothetical protein
MVTSNCADIIKNIVNMTTMIYKQFPELYDHLSETPLYGPEVLDGMSEEELAGYLESLRCQWSTYCRVHHMRRYTDDNNYLRYYIHLISGTPAFS